MQVRFAAAVVFLLLLESTAMADQNDPRLDPLFAALANAADENQAGRIERAIWQIWFEQDDRQVDEHLARGVEAMNRGNYEAALRAFDQVILARADFAEGWNRRATLFYLMGDFQASLLDIRRTLELEPRHFGALSGLALIREAQGRPFEALEALERVTRLHPRMSQLGERIDQLTRQLGEPI